MKPSKRYITDATKVLLEWGVRPNCIIKVFSMYEPQIINRAINFFMVKKRYATEDSFLSYLKHLTEVRGTTPRLTTFYTGASRNQEKPNANRT